MSVKYPPDGSGLPNDPPWYTSKAVKFLDNIVKPDTKILEFGAGRSTVWLYQRTKNIISVESKPKWVEWVKDNTSGIDIRLIQSAQYEICDTFPDESFDLITVDGDDDGRVECVARSVRILKRGGYLLFDNAERAYYKPVYSRPGPGLDCTKILEITDGWEVWLTNEHPVWQHGNWYTAIYQRPMQ